MVRRFCVLFPDGSVNVMSAEGGEAAALSRARQECARYNKGETDDARRAAFGEIEVSLTSFRERF